MKHLAMSMTLLALTTACTPNSGNIPIVDNFSNAATGAVTKAPGAQIPVTTGEIQKLVYNVGPIDLPAGTQVEQSLKKPATLNFQVSEDVWMVGFTPKIVDDRGTPLAGNLLYKAILINKNEENLTCKGGNNGNPFAVASGTLTEVSLPQNYGYALLKEDALEAQVVLTNDSEEDLFGVYFSFELKALPMEKSQGIQDVRPMLLDIDPCQYQPIAVEPSAFVEKSKTFQISESGKLLLASGILSKHGVHVSLTHGSGNTPTILPFWTAESEMDDMHRVINLDPNPFVDTTGKPIHEGDRLILGTAFNNFSDEWQNDATAAAMIYLAPSAE